MEDTLITSSSEYLQYTAMIEPLVDAQSNGRSITFLYEVFVTLFENAQRLDTPRFGRVRIYS